MEFENKTALITGAASGMGLLCSRCWAREGGSVVMVDVDEEALSARAAEISEAGPGKAVAAPCDVRDYRAVCRARDTAVEQFGAIDLLVNFAGGAATRIFHAGGEFPDVPIEVYDWGLDVNLRAQLYFDHAVMKVMREQKRGVIVNIGSITGEEGSANAVDYAAAKSGAMYGLTKSVAMAGAPYGVRCVCVSPGPVLTRPSMSRMKTLLGRAAEPQEIVDMVLYLASDRAAFVTGTNILMDGGRLLAWDRTF